MKKQSLLCAIVCFLLIMVWLLPACATVIKGTSNFVHFRSRPTGAEVYVNGNLMGTTPVRLKLESKQVYYIEFKKEGFETKTYNITNTVGIGWIVLDVICGFVPIIVDAITGAWYELDQVVVNAILEK